MEFSVVVSFQVLKVFVCKINRLGVDAVFIGNYQRRGRESYLHFQGTSKRSVMHEQD
jgi:hypothetical protein